MIVKILTEHYLEFLSLTGGAEARPSLHRSNATLLEISCTGSLISMIKEQSVHFKIKAVFPICNNG